MGELAAVLLATVVILAGITGWELEATETCLGSPRIDLRTEPSYPAGSELGRNLDLLTAMRLFGVPGSGVLQDLRHEGGTE